LNIPNSPIHYSFVVVFLNESNRAERQPGANCISIISKAAQIKKLTELSQMAL